MVGLCGVIGDRRHDPGGDRLFWTGREHAATYADGRIAVRTVCHRAEDATPGRAEGGEVVVWLHGRVFGVEGSGGYRPRTGAASAVPDAQYCADLYASHGPAVLTRLNGEFACVVDDRGRGETWLVTDRVGSRPIYYASTGAGELVFATSLQAIPEYPGVDTGFDPGLLAEYFAYQRVFGARTPLSGVHQLPPASRLRVGRGADRTSRDRYWRPDYDPADRSYACFVEELTGLLLDVLAERLDPGLEYGLLLSGGGDSRLLLAALAELDVPVTVYHMNEWRNEEARIAERAARLAGMEFRFLERDRGYQRRQLSRTPAISECVSTFIQGHAAGFREELADLDVLLSGNTVEELAGWHAGVPTRTLETPLGSIDLPLGEPISDLDDYLAHLETGLPEYVTTPAAVGPVLGEHSATRSSGAVEFHGVTHPSIGSLQVFNELYPMTDDRDYMDYGVDAQITTHWSPFLDTRLLAFGRRYPLAYRLRRNLAYGAIERLAPELARLPNANSRLPGTYPAVVHHAGETYQLARRKFRPKPTPEPHYSHGSWTDDATLIRSDDFVRETIEAHGDLLRRCPFLSLAGARRCYRDHLNGDHNVYPLYRLVTFLEMPVTEQLLGTD